MSLAPQASTSTIWLTGLVTDPQEGYFYDTPPQLSDGTGETLMHRGHNFPIAYSKTLPGAILGRIGQQPDLCAAGQ